MHTRKQLGLLGLLLLLTGTLTLSLAGGAGAQAVYVPSQPSDIATLATRIKTLGMFDRPAFFDEAFTNTTGTNGTVFCDNIRLYHRVGTAVTGLRIVEGNYTYQPAYVIPPNAIMYRDAIEYPAGTYYPVTWNGKRDLVLEPGGQAASDPLPIVIPAGAGAIYTRRMVAIAAPPQTAAATGSGSGGTLAAATYFYKVTTQTTGVGESGPAAEVSAALTGTTSSVTLTWTPPSSAAGFAPLTTTAYNIYRATASGTETLLATVPAGTTAWTDTGGLTPGALAPPGARVWVTNGIVATAYGANGKGDVAGTTFQDLTTSGTIPSSNVYVSTPVAILARPLSGAAVANVAIIGDSIATGTGDSNDFYAYPVRALLAAGNIGWQKLSVGSDGTSQWVLPVNRIQRGQLMENCTHAIVQLGVNDPANMMNNLPSAWQWITQQGIGKVYQCTITNKLGVGTSNNYTLPAGAGQVQLPGYPFGAGVTSSGTTTSATSTTLTDTSKTWTTNQFNPPVGGQGVGVVITGGTGIGQNRVISANTANTLTVPAWTVTPDATSTYRVDAYRVLANDWIRGGAYVLAASPTTASWAGAAGSIPCPYLTGYFEVADLTETARNSGLWKAVNSGVSGTATSATATTLTDTSKAMATNAYLNNALQITGGTGAGQALNIIGNTATTFTVGTWGTQPDNTSAYNVVTAPTGDGTHPGPLMYALMATAIDTTKFKP